MTTSRGDVPSLRVVGIGASAGGLAALEALLAGLPLDSGMAFVVLQHLPASQYVQLAAILARISPLPVADAVSGEPLRPNTVSVVPPQTAAKLHDGTLVLRRTKGVRPPNPIDGLFSSLADVLGDRAIGIVLSGTGSDGTNGLRQILAAGGASIVQDPATAQFDEMPRQAIAMNAATAVLAPAGMGRELAALPERAALTTPAGPPDGFERVLGQLYAASGIDLRSYKRATIERRLARRLTELKLDSYDAYAHHLDDHPDEAAALYEDLLIHVTELFRDGAVLEKAVTTLVREIAGTLPADAPVRVWVPGCSTGEEVYSIAMLLSEQLAGTSRTFQVFGTDVSERAIEIARRGQYPAAVARNAGPHRLAAFFHEEEGMLHISRELRERCIFVRHDLIADPPFSKLHLVSCRNVLIYLEPELQKRVIPIFHYALEQPGYLLLGRSESIAGFENLFETADADARLYLRKAGRRSPLTLPVAGQLSRVIARRPLEPLRTSLDIQRDVDHVLLARYAPASVVVDDALEVVQFRGKTGPYLEAPPGHPQLNILKMAREGLRADLREAIERVKRRDVTVRRERITIRDGREKRTVCIEVIPVRGIVQNKRYFLVVFEDAVPARRAAAKHAPTRDRGEAGRLRQELEIAKEYLHAVLAEHLTTSEALGVANEELQSTNEELQSSNEELQTAKEELQSTNEELETVNNELQHGNERLREANDDLLNVLASVDIAIIIVDTDRRIRRFTPRARDVMKLIPGDIGRPLRDLFAEVADLDARIERVLATLEVHESVHEHSGGRSYRMQIRPYQTADRRIRGAVIAFVDITELRNAVRDSERARDRATTIFDTVATPLVVLDGELHLVTGNGAFHAAYPQGLPSRLTANDVRERLLATLATGTGFDNVETEYRDGTAPRVLRLAARRLPSGDLLLLSIADITAVQLAVRERDAFLGAVSHELRTPLSAIILWAEALRGLSDDDPRRPAAIGAILDAARSENQLVEDLLDVALSRGAGLAVALQPLDATPVVADAIERKHRDAEAKGIRVDQSLAPKALVVADARRLRQIVAGLLDNAIKFTPRNGTIKVTLSAASTGLELQIRDSGPGLSPDEAAHAFEPFWQVDQTSTRAHGGLGIGLTLVKHLVERHGGTIGVESAGPGQGTTFTVRFPTPPDPASHPTR